jgi:hypothetical protein
MTWIFRCRDIPEGAAPRDAFVSFKCDNPDLWPGDQNRSRWPEPDDGDRVLLIELPGGRLRWESKVLTSFCHRYEDEREVRWYLREFADVDLPATDYRLMKAPPEGRISAVRFRLLRPHNLKIRGLVPPRHWSTTDTQPELTAWLHDKGVRVR